MSEPTWVFIVDDTVPPLDPATLDAAVADLLLAEAESGGTNAAGPGSLPENDAPSEGGAG